MESEKFKFAKNLTKKDDSVEQKHLKNLRSSIDRELGEIMQDPNFLGEGQAAKVFNFENNPGLDIPLCIKIFRPELEKLVPIEQKRRQYLTPEKEFDLQVSLIESGFQNTPIPIAYKFDGKYHAFIMEKIVGHTFAEINQHGGHIIEPSWKELDGIIASLNYKHKIIHRDLHLGNIMLKTDQSLTDQEMHKLKGKLYIIDFGASRRVFGELEDSDYTLTIGNNMIRFISDNSSVQMLRPREPGKPGQMPFVF